MSIIFVEATSSPPKARMDRTDWKYRNSQFIDRPTPRTADDGARIGTTDGILSESPFAEAPVLPILTFAIFLGPVQCSVESNLVTDGPNIRQFAFDGDAKTAFVSKDEAKADAHLTLHFDRVVDIRTLSVILGDGSTPDVVLESTTDGKTYTHVATFEMGEAKSAVPRKTKALRVRAVKDSEKPLVVHEFTVDAAPGVAPFRYPIEITFDVADAPEMKEWAEKVVRVCERHYPMICTELASEGFKPTTRIHMAFKSDYNGVAEAAGTRIRGSVKYFKRNPNDIGAMIHETAHCVQLYRQRPMPGWLVEGIADYVRFWKYEPGKAGRLNPETAQYNGSYRTTAAFLAFVTEKYDAKLVTKLNAILRAGRYQSETWRDLTGKSVEELNQEWRRSLVR
jgi:hypothetical protein